MEITLQDKTLYIEQWEINGITIADISSVEMLIAEVEPSVALLVDLYYQTFDALILHEENIAAKFFDLSTGMAGEILQTVSNFRMRLGIIGDFSKYTSNSLRDFMLESNKLGQILFVGTVDEAKERFGRG